MDSYYEEKSWQEFRDAGLLLFVNMFLHIFGWCLVNEYDTNSHELKSAYPARTKFRGFDKQSIDSAYENITEYMKSTSCELSKDISNE